MQASPISRVGLFLGPLLFFVVIAFWFPLGMPEEARLMLAVTAWVATWWITEAIPIAATALLPLILLPILGALPIADAAKNYAHPMVLLYMGGFMIAACIEKWNLHRRIALTIIRWIGSQVRLIILGFMVATAFLSMWISNTATALMMLPIAMAVVTQMDADQLQNGIKPKSIGKALMLGIAYSASIGGVATLIGTPTNLILAGVVQEIYGVEISFARWFMFGLPISMLLLGICWWYLIRYAYPLPRSLKIAGGQEEILQQLRQLGPMSSEEKRVLAVFLGVSFFWISRDVLWSNLIPAIDDTIIALAGVMLLFVLPSSQNSTKLLDWKTAESIPWGILILFGGGLALAEGFKTTGLAVWIGGQFVFLDFLPFWIFLLIIILSVNFLTEITSNVATASMLLPILSAVAISMNVHPFGLMVGATMAASCAFMLPVATPPNAVVFGSGLLTIPDMVRAGLWMNIISVIVVMLFTYFILPFLWGIDLGFNPF